MNGYRLIYPYDSSNVYMETSIKKAADKCYSELKQNAAYAPKFSMMNIDTNAIYKFEIPKNINGSYDSDNYTYSGTSESVVSGVIGSDFIGGGKGNEGNNDRSPQRRSPDARRHSPEDPDADDREEERREIQHEHELERKVRSLEIKVRELEHKLNGIERSHGDHRHIASTDHRSTNHHSTNHHSSKRSESSRSRTHRDHESRRTDRSISPASSRSREIFTGASKRLSSITAIDDSVKNEKGGNCAIM